MSITEAIGTSSAFVIANQENIHQWLQLFRDLVQRNGLSRFINPSVLERNAAQAEHVDPARSALHNGAALGASNTVPAFGESVTVISRDNVAKESNSRAAKVRAAPSDVPTTATKGMSSCTHAFHTQATHGQK